MIFVCLGNPGKRYLKTRHNFGRLFGRYLIEKFAGREKKLKSGRIFDLSNGWKVVFLDCYMNQSGNYLMAIKKKLGLKDFHLVHDDLDIPFGEFKIQFGRGAAGHHGVESIVNTLGTEEFWRIRLGIGRPPEGIAPEKFVLMPFSSEEEIELDRVFLRVCQSLDKQSQSAETSF